MTLGSKVAFIIGCNYLQAVSDPQASVNLHDDLQDVLAAIRAYLHCKQTKSSPSATRTKIWQRCHGEIRV